MYLHLRIAAGLLGLLVIGLCGCGNYKEMTSSPAPNVINEEGFRTLGFASVSAIVFEPNHCLKCHSAAGGNKGGINLETYASAQPNLSDVQSEIESGDMPIGGPKVPISQQNVLNAWISNGAPETSSIPIPD